MPFRSSWNAVTGGYPAFPTVRETPANCLPRSSTILRTGSGGSSSQVSRLRQNFGVRLWVELPLRLRSGLCAESNIEHKPEARAKDGFSTRLRVRLA